MATSRIVALCVAGLLCGGTLLAAGQTQEDQSMCDPPVDPPACKFCPEGEEHVATYVSPGCPPGDIQGEWLTPNQTITTSHAAHAIAWSSPLLESIPS